MLLQQASFGPLPMGNAWSAIEIRAKRLDAPRSTTRGADQVEPLSQAARRDRPRPRDDVTAWDAGMADA